MGDIFQESDYKRPYCFITTAVRCIRISLLQFSGTGKSIWGVCGWGGMEWDQIPPRAMVSLAFPQKRGGQFSILRPMDLCIIAQEMQRSVLLSDFIRWLSP